MMHVTRVATVAAVDGLIANFSLRDGRKRPKAAENEGKGGRQRINSEIECESMKK